ncbi:hypothetical protein [Dactylosporangium sp. NPDC051541]|uniref:hypothetical protein n=1 Tax=Dactylosporangium sp. NPDC051541 TaxID=3363977 RepID=UPI0037BAE031
MLAVVPAAFAGAVLAAFTGGAVLAAFAGAVLAVFAAGAVLAAFTGAVLAAFAGAVPAVVAAVAAFGGAVTALVGTGFDTAVAFVAAGFDTGGLVATGFVDALPVGAVTGFEAFTTTADVPFPVSAVVFASARWVKVSSTNPMPTAMNEPSMTARRIAMFSPAAIPAHLSSGFPPGASPIRGELGANIHVLNPPTKPLKRLGEQPIRG